MANWDYMTSQPPFTLEGKPDRPKDEPQIPTVEDLLIFMRYERAKQLRAQRIRRLLKYAAIILLAMLGAVAGSAIVLTAVDTLLAGGGLR